MPVSVSTICHLGLEGRMIHVEVDISNGLPSFTIVGLADTAVLEARERIRLAIKNSGYAFPPTRKTISLAPADMRKHGPAFDLAMAVGLLAASKQIPLSAFKGALLGELSLSGEVRPIPGIIPLLLYAKKSGMSPVIIPKGNADEASIIDGLEVHAVSTLQEAVAYFQGKRELEKIIPRKHADAHLLSYNTDPFDGIVGQEKAKKAIAIAAAGHHNIILSGPPGIGKSLLAHAIQKLLPPLTAEEFLEVASMYSIRGINLFDQTILKLRSRPVREIHHTSSLAAIIGGTSELLPGEISLAHRGVLVLDEISEFPRDRIEALRQPIEEGSVTLSRASGTVTYPAKFLILATTNPCPCGFLGDRQTSCRCTQGSLKAYQRRISGPILDRIDLRVSMEPVSRGAMITQRGNEKSMSQDLMASVILARSRQQMRYANTACITNADLTSKELSTYCILDASAQKLLIRAAENLSLSARGIHRMIKLARTIADMEPENHERINMHHVMHALQYRDSNAP